MKFQTSCGITESKTESTTELRLLDFSMEESLKSHFQIAYKLDYKLAPTNLM